MRGVAPQWALEGNEWRIQTHLAYGARRVDTGRLDVDAIRRMHFFYSLMKQKHPACPLCALHHTLASHRCQNPTYPKDGHTKPVPGCGPISPPQCPNCGSDHDAFSKECQARPIPPSEPESLPADDDTLDARSDSEEELEIRDASGQAPSTPETTAAQAVDLTTPRPPRRSADLTGGLSQPLERSAPTETPPPRRVRPGDD